jgi:8-hydroxy-5-deazaflavin:NADPH oxidoreductase
MNVGIIGSGDVGKTLAAGFIHHGHQVMVGTRHPANLAEWQRQNAQAVIGTFREAATFGDMAVLAVKGSAALDAARAVGGEALAGKPVIDATVPVAEGPPQHGVLSLFTGKDDSLMERLQKELPRAHLVKAFSSVGSDRMVNPRYEAGKPTMFICGNDANAKRAVATLLEQFGWETEDMGHIEAARAIEPLAVLWCIPGFLHDRWTHAFKLLK